VEGWEGGRVEKEGEKRGSGGRMGEGMYEGEEGKREGGMEVQKVEGRKGRRRGGGGEETLNRRAEALAVRPLVAYLEILKSQLYSHLLW